MRSLPAASKTEMIAGLTPEMRERFMNEIPLRRFCSPAEVAAAVAFLVSEDASFVNGATIDVNGGWAMI